MKFFKDDETGDVYIWNGEELEKIKDGSDGKGNDQNDENQNNQDGTQNQQDNQTSTENNEEPEKEEQDGDSKDGESSENSDQQSDDQSGKDSDNGQDGNKSDSNQQAKPSDKPNNSNQGGNGDSSWATDTIKSKRKDTNVQRINDFLNDSDAMGEIAKGFEGEVIKPGDPRANKKDYADISDYKSGPVNLKNKDDLIKSVKNCLTKQALDEIERIKYSFRTLDLRRLSVDQIVKGRQIEKIYKKNKPIINVYQDVSGSWRGELEISNEIVAALAKLQSQGLIEVRLKYFATRVSNNIGSAGSGTNGGPVMQDIKKERPTNVLIITDGDVTDYNYDMKEEGHVRIKGNVWFVWKHDSKSSGFLKFLSGKNVIEFDAS